MNAETQQERFDATVKRCELIRSTRPDIELPAGVDPSEWEHRNGTYLAPAGLSEAIADDDAAEMDRLMSALEAQTPELFTMPAGAA